MYLIRLHYVKSNTVKAFIGMAAAAATLSACHYSNGEYGPAGAAPVVVPGSSNGKATYKGGYSGTNTHLLQGAPQGANPSLDDGAGFVVPNYPSTTLPGWIQGHPPGPTVLSYRNSPYGKILTTSSGKTLYVRLGDQYRQSFCYSICARAFPPFLTNGAPQASGGVLAAYVGVLEADLSGQREQVAYGQHPLYTYSGDTGPGQYNAEGKGGIWYVINVQGIVVKAPLGTVSTSTTTNG
jgi:predicted lipoprotein with Yx(FWY)xxD motif